MGKIEEEKMTDYNLPTDIDEETFGMCKVNIKNRKAIITPPKGMKQLIKERGVKEA